MTRAAFPMMGVAVACGLLASSMGACAAKTPGKAQLMGECKLDALRKHREPTDTDYIEACMESKGYEWSAARSHCNTAFDAQAHTEVSLDPTCYVRSSQDR
jgi:hypothetical protein